MSASTPPSLTHLAAMGGAKSMPEGPPGWPPRDETIRAALEQVYGDGDWGRYHGERCRRLAAELCQFHQVEHATLCCSGTFAVELSLRGLGIGPGDEVILAGYDFPGNFRAIEACRAIPVLVDVAADNWNLDVGQLKAAIGNKTRAVLASHLHGGIVPMSRLLDIAAQHGLAVVEDACQCPGATVEGRPAGTWGDVGVLSFGGSKLLTAGRGGAILTRRADVQQRAKIYCERGNHAFPLSELQAAVLLPQLARLNERNAVRAKRVQRLLEHLSGTKAFRPLAQQLPRTRPGYYKLGFQFQAKMLPSVPRETLIEYLHQEGIAVDAGFRGFSRRSSRRCRTVGDLPQSRLASEQTLLLHHPILLEPEETIDRLAAGIVKVCAALAATE
ncbi:MAG: DegT/DnrJ/EryC1/StrS family aminotransferase [Pirellulales bacterium]